MRPDGRDGIGHRIRESPADSLVVRAECWPRGHGLGAGSHATSPWSLMLTGACMLLVGAALLLRIAPPAGQALRRSCSHPRTAPDWFGGRR
jgi:hypothetical protein